MAAHRPKIALTHFHSGSNIRQVSQRLFLSQMPGTARATLYILLSRVRVCWTSSVPKQDCTLILYAEMLAYDIARLQRTNRCPWVTRTLTQNIAIRLHLSTNIRTFKYPPSVRQKIPTKRRPLHPNRQRLAAHTGSPNTRGGPTVSECPHPCADGTFATAASKMNTRLLF